MSLRYRSATLLLALACAASGAFPQAAGRLMLQVVDDAGEPLAGVRVTATSAELTKLREEVTTNKKGIAAFAFGDATRVYEFLLEKEGYQGVQAQLKPEVGGVARETVTMLPAGAAAPEPAMVDEAKRRFSPAEEAFNEGVLALRGGDTDTARRKLEEALEKDPDMVPAHSGLAAIYLAVEEYQAAADAANHVLTAAPDDSRAWRILYEAQRALGNEQEAARALARLRELDQAGGTAPMLYNEAVDALRLGDRESARQRLREALESDPDLVPALAVLSALLLEEGEHDEAATLAERVLTHEPEHERALTVRYEAYRLMGDEERARKALGPLLEVAPDAVTKGWLEEGVARFERGDTEGARELFTRVLEADPEHAEAHYRLALCHLSAEQNEEARRHLQRFLELAPNHPEAGNAREMLEFLR